MMRPQRAREGESRVEMQAAKWTAEGAVNKVLDFQYSATWRHTSVAGDMLVSCRVYGAIRKSRWHRGRFYFQRK